MVSKGRLVKTTESGRGIGRTWWELGFNIGPFGWADTRMRRWCVTGVAPPHRCPDQAKHGVDVKDGLPIAVQNDPGREWIGHHLPGGDSGDAKRMRAPELWSWNPAGVNGGSSGEGHRLKHANEETHRQEQKKGVGTPRRQERKQRESAEGEGEDFAPTPAVGNHSTGNLQQRIANEECREHPAELVFAPTEFLHHDWGGNGDIDTIDIVNN